MASSKKDVFDYLLVDDFLKSFIHARALRTAYEVGLIDDLVKNNSRSFEGLKNRCKMDDRGLALLLGLLSANNVIEKTGKAVELSERFKEALAYSDILIAKLEFSHLVTTDFTDLFTDLLNNPGQFGRKARIFDLFGYNRCVEFTPENYQLTQRWMRITTCLTKYETLAAMEYHDFSRYRRLLDIGGNSGEFALQLCRKYDSLEALVFDLPLVCDIGRKHADTTPEGKRVRFVKGTAFTDPLPDGFDLITFKSMLHDWPEKEARNLLTRAARVLEPGGTLLIYERGPIDVDPLNLPYSMLPNLLFFRSFRSPQVYEDYLRQLGFQNIETRAIDLEMPFFLLTANKKG